jgi:hypothetical protein
LGIDQQDGAALGIQGRDRVGQHRLEQFIECTDVAKVVPRAQQSEYVIVFTSDNLALTAGNLQSFVPGMLGSGFNSEQRAGCTDALFT